MAKAFGQFKRQEGLEIVVGSIHSDCQKNGWPLDIHTIANVLGEKRHNNPRFDRTLAGAVYGWMTEECDYADQKSYDAAKRRDALLARVIKNVKGRGY